MTPFLHYCRAKEYEELEQLSYRIYVTESIRLYAEGKMFTESWRDMFVRQTKPQDTRTAEQIAVDVIRNAGLIWEGGEGLNGFIHAFGETAT